MMDRAKNCIEERVKRYLKIAKGDSNAIKKNTKR